MEIVFGNQKFEEQCNNEKLLRRAHGTDRARRIRKRLDDLRAAETLQDLRNLPGRCHELKGKLAANFSLDLDHPYRLVFRPRNNPAPTLDDGGIDWSRVTIVEILCVEDTHE